MNYINDFCKEYGYPTDGDNLVIEKVGDSISKATLLSCTGAAYVIAYSVQSDTGHDAESIFQQYATTDDDFCSLYLIQFNDRDIEYYSKSFSTGVFTRLSDPPYYKYPNQLIKEMSLIDDKLENLFFEMHSDLRDIDGMHPDEALDELCKILYTKLYDETCHSEDGDYIFSKFYGNAEEHSASIRKLYREANSYDLRVYSLRVPGYKRSRGVFDDPIRASAAAVSKIASSLETYDFTNSDLDLKARAFQKVFTPAARSGMGQYFTPLSVIKFIVGALAPNSNDLIIDPFSGSGHFLSESIDYVRAHETGSPALMDFAYHKLHGIEKSERMVRIAMTDMRLHGDGHSNIRCTDALLPFSSYSDVSESSFDIVMTNPPFGSILQSDSYSYLGKFELLEGKSRIPLEVLGLERSIQLLQTGGRLGIVIPESILANKTNSYVRDWLMRKVKIRAIVSLPLATFAPFGANIKTSILIATKAEESGASNYKIFTGQIDDIGHDSKGKTTSNSDWQDMLNEFRSFIGKEGW